MTNEELCLRYQAGDAGAAEELISRNMGLIRSIAIRYAHDYQNARMDADDYTQEGVVALLRAASQYDPSREVQFLTYAGRAVRNAIIDAIRADNPNLVLTPLDEAHTGCADDNDDADLFIGRMKTRLPSSYEADPETICIRKEQLEELYTAIHALPPRHHTWVVCRYGFDDDAYKSLAESDLTVTIGTAESKWTSGGGIGRDLTAHVYYKTASTALGNVREELAEQQMLTGEVNPTAREPQPGEAAIMAEIEQKRADGTADAFDNLAMDAMDGTMTARLEAMGLTGVKTRLNWEGSLHFILAWGWDAETHFRVALRFTPCSPATVSIAWRR